MNQSFQIYFAHSQILIYDDSVSPYLAWTDQHFNQGFIRRDGVICLGTILEFGHANVEIIHGDYNGKTFERVIRCPLKVISGSIWVSGTEADLPEKAERRVSLELGLYAVTCAQSETGDDELRVVLFFSKNQSLQSEILTADPYLHPIFPLLETGEEVELL
jgi:Competence protein J (ComJ)